MDDVDVLSRMNRWPLLWGGIMMVVALAIFNARRTQISDRRSKRDVAGTYRSNISIGGHRQDGPALMGRILIFSFLTSQIT